MRSPSPSPPGRARFLIHPDQVGLRFDQAVAALTPLSRRKARAWIGEGTMWRNGRPTRNQSRPVELGEVIELPTPIEGEEIVSTPPTAISIVHEDEALLAVDKPFGVLSQPAETRQPGELAMDEQALLAKAWSEGRPPFLRLVHRLDRVTSGLLLFARAPQALAPLADCWREGRVERHYLAVVEGIPEEGRQTVEAPIGRDPSGAWRFEVAFDGKPAATRVDVLHAVDGFALVECSLLTGRTHQVRVHLAHLGHPVAGDRLYGARHDPAQRPLL